MITENELLRELAADMYYPEIEKDEVTARMLSDAAEIGYTAAKHKLDADLEAGKLTSRSVKCNGRIVTAYKRV